MFMSALRRTNGSYCLSPSIIDDVHSIIDLAAYLLPDLYV